MTRTRKAEFVPDHYQSSKSEVDTGIIHEPDEAALFAFGDQHDYAPEPDELIPFMPETNNENNTDDYPKHAIDALEKVVKAFNKAGQNKGRDIIKKTGGNRFQTRYASQRGNHPDTMTDRTDGKETGLMISVGLAKSSKPEAKKTARDRKREAEGHKVLDTLNDTDARLAAGEPKEEVEASRGRFAKLLIDELSPDTERQVDAGDRTIPKKVDAEYRNGLYKNPDKGMFFLSKLRLRSR